MQQHTTCDDFWRERNSAERLEDIEVPLYSIGIWGKVDLHTRGNIDDYRRASGPKKLRMNGPPNVFAANQEFNSVALHRDILLPFYDHYLKGMDTDYAARPGVEYFMRGAGEHRVADSWPPAGVKYINWHLNDNLSGSVTAFNDRGLSREAGGGGTSTSYGYPDPGWMMDVVGMGPAGAPGADLHHRCAGRRFGNRRADQAATPHIFDHHRRGYYRQAVRTDAAIARRP